MSAAVEKHTPLLFLKPRSTKTSQRIRSMKTPQRIRHAATFIACLALAAGWFTPAIAEPPEPAATKKMITPSSLTEFVRASNDRDTDSLAACFAKDAVVYDQGEILRGAAEIRHWIADGFKKFQYVVAPTGVKNSGKDVVLTAVLTGTFPGGRVSLDFHCRIDSDKIAVMIVQHTPAAK
jgi:hypothetical protein